MKASNNKKIRQRKGKKKPTIKNTNLEVEEELSQEKSTADGPSKKAKERRMANLILTAVKNQNIDVTEETIKEEQGAEADICSYDLKEEESIMEGDAKIEMMLQHMMATSEVIEEALKERENDDNKGHAVFELKSHKRFQILDGKLSEIQPVLNELRENADNFEKEVQNNIQDENSEMFINFDEFHTESLNAQTETIVQRLRNENVKFHKVFTCDNCPKEFKSTMGLERHKVKVHFPAMSFKRIQMTCGIEGCGVKSRIPQIMTYHQKAHSNGKYKYKKLFVIACFKKACTFTTTNEKTFLKHLAKHKIFQHSSSFQALLHDVSEDDKCYFLENGIGMEPHPSALWTKNPFK